MHLDVPEDKLGRLRVSQVRADSAGSMYKLAKRQRETAIPKLSGLERRS